MKTVEEIKGLKNSQAELEAAVEDACQHVLERTTELDAVARVNKLGAAIVQLQSETIILEALIHPSMPPEQITARKGEIEKLETQLDDLEKDTQKVIDVTTQF